MQEPSEILLTLAEVAVAFVGFAGIASVFARRLDSAPQAVVAVRLRGMVDAGLVACFAAVLPLIIASYPMSTSASWRLSSLVFAVAWSLVFLNAQARLRRLSKSGVSWSGSAWRGTTWIFYFAAATPLLASACGVVRTLEAPFYLSALFAVMVLAGILFLRVLLILVPAEPTL